MSYKYIYFFLDKFAKASSQINVLFNHTADCLEEQWMCHHPKYVSPRLFQVLWAQQGGCVINLPRAWKAVKSCAVAVDMTPLGLDGSPNANANSNGAVQWSAETVRIPWTSTPANHTSALTGWILPECLGWHIFNVSFFSSVLSIALSFFPRLSLQVGEPGWTFRGKVQLEQM